MQPATGAVPPPMDPQYQQWMMMNQQQSYHQQQPQQSYHQQQPPLMAQPQYQPPQQMYYNQQPPQAAAAQSPQQKNALTTAAAAQPTTPDEIRTLWIGDLQFWMDEQYLISCFSQSGEVVSAKVIRNKTSGQSEGYGFIEFVNHAAAERNLHAFNNTLMPNVEQNFRLNWASLGGGEKRANGSGPEFSIFVGDLAPDVTDYLLQETFRPHFPSVKGAKVVTDQLTGRTKGYGFVKFSDESEMLSAMTEMNGRVCSSRPMRIGPAANKKNTDGQQYSKASYQNTQGSQSEDDPHNTTIFVGGLDPNVTDDHLRQVFSQYGQLVHVKIPIGKRCGFVQFAERNSAEEALRMLQGTQLGGQAVRLSWGRSPANKQPQVEQNPMNSGYYGYGQGYEAYGYAPAAQNPSMYYGGYPGYGAYPQAQQQPPQQ